MPPTIPDRYRPTPFTTSHLDCWAEQAASIISERERLAPPLAWTLTGLVAPPFEPNGMMTTSGTGIRILSSKASKIGNASDQSASRCLNKRIGKSGRIFFLLLERMAATTSSTQIHSNIELVFDSRSLFAPWRLSSLPLPPQRRRRFLCRRSATRGWDDHPNLPSICRRSDKAYPCYDPALPNERRQSGTLNVGRNGFVWSDYRQTARPFP